MPALAGPFYTMPGMQTILHGVINKPGAYRGFSANYSGAGFTDMRFTFHGMNPRDFDQWVAKVRAAGGDLDRAAYDKLRQPSRAAPVQYYARFDTDLYQRILNLCVDPGHECKSQMMAAAMHTGQAMPGHATEGVMSMPMPADAPKPATAQATVTY